MIDPSGFIISAGTGALTGFIIGLALRKAISFMLTMFGLFILGLAGLSYLGLASVDFAGIVALLEQLFIKGVELGSPLLSSFGGPSFSIPFLLGLMGGTMKGSGSSLSLFSRRRVLR